MATSNTIQSNYAGGFSSEGSQYGEAQAIWAPSPGQEGQKVKTGEKLVGIGATAGAGYFAWNHAPGILRGINSGLKESTRFGFSANTGQTKTDFWYQFARRVENTTLKSQSDNALVRSAGQFSSGLFNMFSRATYASESLSFFTDRGNKPIFLDIGEGLGPQARKDTLDYLVDFFEIDRKRIHNLNNISFLNGELYEGLEASPGNLKLGQKLSSVKALLPDQGRMTLAYLTSVMPKLGLRESDTGAIRARSVFGMSGMIPVPAKMGGTVFAGNKAIEVSNSFKFAETYVTAALQRTSFLIDEMIGEAKKFFEFVDPEGKKKLFAGMKRTGLVPEMTLGSAPAMLTRYSALGMKVFAGWAAMNQLGYMVQNGNALEKGIGGGGQAALLGYAGRQLGNMLNGRGRAGALIGLASGALGAVGIGPFSSGVMPGVAQTAGNLNEFRSMLGEVSFVNDIRRTFESIAPGSTSFSTAIGMGVATGFGVTALSRHLNKDQVTTQSLRKKYLESLDWDRLTDIPNRIIKPGMEDVHNSVPESIRRSIDREVESFNDLLLNEKRAAELNNPFGKTGDTHAIKASKLGEVLTTRSYNHLREEISKDSRHWFEKVLKTINKAPFIRAAMYSSTLAAGIYALGTGQLGTLETPQEMRLKNEGKILEEVKRGQKWEFGSTPYEGTDKLFYRPTMIARVSSGAGQAGATGDRGALEEFILKNFSYKLERENYWNRPAPITSAAFDQIPFLYPLLKPFGDLIKRAKLMHVDEWARIGDSGEIEYLERSTGLEALPDPALGATPMSAPYSPYTPGRVWGNAFTQATNLSGLLGFYAREGLKTITGSSSIYDQRSQLESFSENVDMTSRFYDLHSGGGFLGIPFLSEPIRRFLSKDNIKNHNPIKNNLPNWMPQELAYGNQYASLRHGGGEYRLPGEGYETRFPELRGVDPNDYPILHRFNILGDVAPWSSGYRKTKNEIRKMASDGELTQEQESFFYNYSSEVEAKLRRREFDSYAYKQDQYQKVHGVVDTVDPLTGSFTLRNSNARYTAAGLSNEGSRLIAELNLSRQQAASVQRDNAALIKTAIQPGMHVDVTTYKALDVDGIGARPAAIVSEGRNINRHLRSNGSFATEEGSLETYAMATGAGRMIGGGYQTLTHTLGKMTAPVEYLTTFGMAPIQKFLPERDVLEEYQQMHMYGEEVRLWQKPFSHWFAPAIKSGLHSWLGLNFESPGLAKNRKIEEYFDKLKYEKYQLLAKSAYERNDIQSAKHYESIGRKTVIGANGFFQDQRFKNAMGGVENKYSIGFMEEKDPVKRQRILKSLPGFKRRMMEGQYAQQELKGLKRVAINGGLTSEQQAKLNSLNQFKQDEGYSRTFWSQRGYNKNKSEGESYASYMRRQEMEEWKSKNKVPDANWVGFNPAVDIEDVKLKYIEEEGLDYHDFSIYPSRASYLHRKPYITDGDVAQMQVENYSEENVRLALREANRQIGNDFSNISYNMQGGMRMQNSIIFDLEQNNMFLPTGN